MSGARNGNGNGNGNSQSWIYTIIASAFFVLVQGVWGYATSSLQNQISELKKDQSHAAETFIQKAAQREYEKAIESKFFAIHEEQERNRSLVGDIIRDRMVPRSEYVKDMASLQTAIKETRDAFNATFPATKTFEQILERISRLETLKFRPEPLPPVLPVGKAP